MTLTPDLPHRIPVAPSIDGTFLHSTSSGAVLQLLVGLTSFRTWTLRQDFVVTGQRAFPRHEMLALALRWVDGMTSLLVHAYQGCEVSLANTGLLDRRG